MTPTKKIFFTVLFFLSPGFLFSQEIITDRPDRTESVETVGKNKFQIETGIEYSLLKYKVFLTDETGRELGVSDLKFKTLTAPTTLLRFGITKKIEIRLGFDFDRTTTSFDTIEFDSDSKLSLNPPTIGAKFEVAKGKGIVPDFSVLGSVKIPDVGDEFKKVKHFSPEVVLLFSNEINDNFSVGYNLGVEWSDDMSDKEFFYSVSLGTAVSPRLGAFAEIYGNLPASTDASNQNIDGGFTYLIKDNIQVDIYGGLGLTEEANNFMLGTGIAFKF